MGSDNIENPAASTDDGGALSVSPDVWQPQVPKQRKPSMNFYTKYYTSLLGSELRQVDFQPAMKLLKEYAVSVIVQRNDALFIVQTLEDVEERTELQEELLKAMRLVHEIEERRCKSLSEGIRNLEEFARIPPPVWPQLRKGG